MKPIIFDINGKQMTKKEFEKLGPNIVCSALLKEWPYKTDFDTHILEGTTYIGKSYVKWRAEKSFSATSNVWDIQILKVVRGSEIPKKYENQNAKLEIVRDFLNVIQKYQDAGESIALPSEEIIDVLDNIARQQDSVIPMCAIISNVVGECIKNAGLEGVLLDIVNEDTQKLFLVELRNQTDWYKSFYVIAKSPNGAYEKVRTFLTEHDLCFTIERELR